MSRELTHNAFVDHRQVVRLFVALLRNRAQIIKNTSALFTMVPFSMTLNLVRWKKCALGFVALKLIAYYRSLPNTLSSMKARALQNPPTTNDLLVRIISSTLSTVDRQDEYRFATATTPHVGTRTSFKPD